MGTLVNATDAKGSQTLGTNAPAKQMEGTSALGPNASYVSLTLQCSLHPQN